MRSLVFFCMLYIKLVLIDGEGIYDFIKMNISGFPCVVGIFRDKVLVAGGTILSEQFVLSMVHVFEDNYKYHVKAGSVYMEGEDNLIPVLKLFKHDDYNTTTYKNGICLVQLEDWIKLGPAAMPAALPVENIIHNKSHAIGGWGKQQPDKHFRLALVKTTIHQDENPCISDMRKDSNIVCVLLPFNLFDFIDISTPLLDEDGHVQAVGVKKSETGSTFMIVKPFTDWLQKLMKEHQITTTMTEETVPSTKPTEPTEPTSITTSTATEIETTGTTEKKSDDREVGSAQTLQTINSLYYAFIVFSFFF